MGNYYLGFILGLVVLSAQAQPYVASTVEKLDQLEQNRILLTKELEVAKLQAELQKANEDVGLGVTTGMTGTGSALRLVKVSGLASKPEAIFLYGGYRVAAQKGSMVVPNIQMTSVTQSYVVLKDITTGKENVLWLSAADTSSSTGTNGTPNNPTR